MALWYGIPGIEFHYNGNTKDPEITYNGIRDNSCVVVEETMFDWFEEDYPVSRDVNWFDEYMLARGDEVKELIDLARGTTTQNTTGEEKVSYTLEQMDKINDLRARGTIWAPFDGDTNRGYCVVMLVEDDTIFSYTIADDGRWFVEELQATGWELFDENWEPLEYAPDWFMNA